VAAKVLAALEDPFAVQDLTLDVGASIGIACYPDHGDDMKALVQRADVAMYVAKQQRSGFVLYQPDEDPHSPARLALAGELRQAVECDELALRYQPKVELRNGRIAGVEALVRWRHPKLGLLDPSEFVALAEQTGIIKPLTLAVLDGALRDCRAWQEEGLELMVAVNLSPRNLLDQELATAVAHRLEQAGIPAERLCFEITEGTIMADPARAKDMLERLAGMGVRLAVDDFGTGYSSLSYLKQLPVNELKIDRSFVRDMAEERSDALIVQSTIDLGQNLGLEVVAEGVETQGVMDELSLLGCHYAQGYYVSRPLPAEELADWISEFSVGVKPQPVGRPSS
jgi:predicted signal transduction protein with EAL and GGDEF domain